MTTAAAAPFAAPPAPELEVVPRGQARTSARVEEPWEDDDLPTRPAKKVVRAARWSKAEEEHYRAKLLAARTAILKNLEELREELRGLQEPSHELEEWAQEEKDRDILIRLELREKEELTRIQAALARLEEGTYGMCARCGRRIRKERLEEIPTAVFCRACQV